MPALNPSTPAWVTTLRKMVRSQHGKGWSISSQSGRVKLTCRWADGSTSSAMLALPWSHGSATAVLSQLQAIRARMDESGLSLAEAVALQAEADATSTTPTGQISIAESGGDGTDWEAVVDRYARYKTFETGDVSPDRWEKNNVPSMRQLLQVMGARPAPRTGRDVLAGLRDTFGGEPGSRGRQVRIQQGAALLRYAVQHCGAASRWLPPDDLSSYIGRRSKLAVHGAGSEESLVEEGSTPIKDEQLLRLLDGIPDARWRLAVGLMACFGLRPVELRYLKVIDGDKLRCTYSKRASRGSTKPRDLAGLDPLGRQSLSSQMLGQLALAGTVKGAPGLPSLGPRDDGTASAISTYLRRRPVWLSLREQTRAEHGKPLSVYGFRHGYALRAHKLYELSPRVTAKLMGHSLQTHLGHYGRWADEDTVLVALARASERFASKHPEPSLD